MLHHKFFHSQKKQCVVIIHGLFGTMDNWTTLAKRFSEFVDVLTVDIRNHGKSFHDSDIQYDSLAKDILMLLDHYQLDQAIILGHSYGGKIAMHFAGMYPMRTEQLVVVDIAPYAYPAHHQGVFRVLDDLDLPNIPDRKVLQEKILLLEPNQALAQFFLKGITRDEEDKSFRFKFNYAVLKAQYDYIIGFVPYLPYEGNVLFIAGSLSNYISKDTMTHTAEIFPNYQIAIVPNAGHWVHSDQPNDFFNILKNYINI
ncbi:MAG: alpha/beta fold hydrolase [Chitinophagales bacterium]|jgi:pimeloyl-ACP methyl ester carboxylesterase|nr:alpha/beta fold hydrolase [Chitinophagales bacterium]